MWLTVRRWPRAPLHTVNRAQIAIWLGPFVPNRHAALGQPVVVGRAGQKPQELGDDGFDEDLFRRHQRKALAQVIAHLVAKHAFRARTGAIRLEHAVGIDVA